MAYARHADRIAAAEAWLEKRMRRLGPRLLARYCRRGKAAVRLVVKRRVVDLYKPYDMDAPYTTSDSVRRIARRLRYQADCPPAVDGKRGSLVFVFRIDPTERKSDE